MTISARDKRTLMLFGPVAGLLAILAVYRWVSLSGPEAAAVVSPVQSVAAAEKKLARFRQLAATVDVREAGARRAAAALADREKGIIQAATAAQAQAQLLQVVRRIGKAQAPPIELRSVELGQVQPIGTAYGQTSVSVTIECRIEQLVNLLADLTAQPELLAPSDLRISSGDPKQKLMQVRVTVAGVVPRALVPEKKGGPAF
jgi:hypothetical protein